MINVESILFQFLDAKRELKLIEDRIAMIRSDLLPKSPEMSGLPGSHNHKDRFADMMVKLDELCEQEDRQRRKAIHTMQVVEELIEKANDPLCKAILYDRYIMGNKWESIAEHMGYTVRRVLQLRRQALNELTNHLDDGK